MLPHEAGTPPSYAITKDNKGQVCAGINSLAYPRDFAFTASLNLADRPAAVAGFYQREFWNEWMNQLSNPVAAYLLDSCVNQGPVTGVKILQRAVAFCDGEAMVYDGLLGTQTVSRANSCPPTTLRAAFQTEREDAYRQIGGPNLTKWLERAKLWPPFS